MPSIPGDWLTDIDGNRLLDESANPIAEAAVQVLVVGGGYLVTAATGGAISPAAGSLVLEGYVQLLKQLFPAGTEAVNVIDVLNAIKLQGDRWIPTTGLSYQAYMLDLQTWLQANWPTSSGGGLTTEEHDKLLSISPLDTDLIASAIWGYNFTLTDMNGYDAGPMAQSVLGDVWSAMVNFAGKDGFRIEDRPHFRYCVFDLNNGTLYSNNWTRAANQTAVPVLDFSLVQAGDTVYSYLTREYPGFAWTLAGPGSVPAGGTVWLTEVADSTYFRCTLTDADLLAASVTVTVPDVNVTVNIPTPPVLEDPTFERSYQAEIAFTRPFVHTGACDGVLFTIGGTGRGVKAFNVDGHTALTGAGVIGFTDADGRPEKFQYVNWETGILVPMTMRRASGFFWSSNVSLSGTVTPFTLVPVTP